MPDLQEFIEDHVASSLKQVPGKVGPLFAVCLVFVGHDQGPRSFAFLHFKLALVVIEAHGNHVCLINGLIIESDLFYAQHEC